MFGMYLKEAGIDLLLIDYICVRRVKRKIILGILFNFYNFECN